MIELSPVCKTYDGARSHIAALPLSERWKLLSLLGTLDENKAAKKLYHQASPARVRAYERRKKNHADIRQAGQR
jgi:hypothetical protein